ncbi:hypothetical protein BLOT_007016 [Blomia tropicalis]|nr:hypothetical protein BLOT_007016 [Blomia tropicalis]
MNDKNQVKPHCVHSSDLPIRNVENNGTNTIFSVRRQASVVFLTTTTNYAPHIDGQTKFRTNDLNHNRIGTKLTVTD